MVKCSSSFGDFPFCQKAWRVFMYCVKLLLHVLLLGVPFKGAKAVSQNNESVILKGVYLNTFSTKSDQPDNIYYDDWNPQWGYSPCRGCYGAVRFTAPSDFFTEGGLLQYLQCPRCNGYLLCYYLRYTWWPNTCWPLWRCS